jgi:hypothetical protein
MSLSKKMAFKGKERGGGELIREKVRDAIVHKAGRKIPT